MEQRIDEIKLGLLTRSEVKRLIDQKSVFLMKGSKRDLLIGKETLVKVNCNFGITRKYQKENEIKKIQSISKLLYSPDMMMDLSLVNNGEPIWKEMAKYHEGPIGFLPHYSMVPLLNGSCH